MHCSWEKVIGDVQDVKMFFIATKDVRDRTGLFIKSNAKNGGKKKVVNLVIK